VVHVLELVMGVCLLYCAIYYELQARARSRKAVVPPMVGARRRLSERRGGGEEDKK